MRRARRARVRQPIRGGFRALRIARFHQVNIKMVRLDMRRVATQHGFDQPHRFAAAAYRRSRVRLPIIPWAGVHRSLGSEHRDIVVSRETARNVEHRVGISRIRSEEHTSELQSLMSISYAVFCLKKKK